MNRRNQLMEFENCVENHDDSQILTVCLVQGSSKMEVLLMYS